jgi:hypothetical protein
VSCGCTCVLCGVLTAPFDLIGARKYNQRVVVCCVQVRVYTKKVGHKPDFTEPVVCTADRWAKGRAAASAFSSVCKWTHARTLVPSHFRSAITHCPTVWLCCWLPAAAEAGPPWRRCASRFTIS